MSSLLVAKNAVILVFVEIFSKIFEFISAVVLARVLGVEKYGIFAFVWASSLLFGLLTHFGFDSLIVRDVSRDKRCVGRYLVGIFIVKCILLIIALFIFICWIDVFLVVGEYKKKLLFTGIFTAFFMNNLIFSSAFFRAYQKANIEAIIRVLVSIFVSGISMIIAYMTGNLFYLLLARLIIYIYIFILSIYLINRYLNPDFLDAFKEIWFFLKAGWPFAVSVFFIFLYINIDVVMLNLMKGDEATGLYSIAVKILTVFMLIPLGVSNAVLPALSNYRKEGSEEFFRLSENVARYMLIIAFFVILFNITLGKYLVGVFFGEAYRISGNILSLITFTLIFLYMNHLAYNMFLASNKERNLIILTASGACFNIIMNLILIPKYSYYGAAIATILSEGIIFIIAYFMFQRFYSLSWGVIRKNYGVIVLGILCMFISRIFTGISSLYIFIINSSIFIFFMFYIGYIDKKDIDVFLRYCLNKKDIDNA